MDKTKKTINSRTYEQRNVQDLVPLQETSDSIYDMLKRICKLKGNNIESNDYQTLLKRVKTQAYCLQGILNDGELRKTEQYRKIETFFNNLVNDNKNNQLVRHCVGQIMPIITGKMKLSENCQYKPVHASSSMITNFFKANNYIENRYKLAEADPEGYRNSAKLGGRASNEKFYDEKPQSTQSVKVQIIKEKIEKPQNIPTKITENKEQIKEKTKSNTLIEKPSPKKESQNKETKSSIIFKPESFQKRRTVVGNNDRSECCYIL